MSRNEEVMAKAKKFDTRTYGWTDGQREIYTPSGNSGQDNNLRTVKPKVKNILDHTMN